MTLVDLTWLSHRVSSVGRSATLAALSLDLWAMSQGYQRLERGFAGLYAPRRPLL